MLRHPAIVLDVSDLGRAARFWGTLLGVTPGPVRSAGDYQTIGPLDSGPLLVLQRVSDLKSSKNRMHLDFTVDDVDVASSEIERLGGSIISEPRPGGGVTAADPDGNEFCIAAFVRDRSGARRDVHSPATAVKDEVVMADSDRVMVQSHRTRPIPGSCVRALFDQEGWWPERGEAVLARLVAAGPAVGAWSGRNLVGFARLITDGTCRAYLEDVLVRRDMRGCGIGTELIQALHRELADDAIVTAFFGPRLEGFYGRLGYIATQQVVAHHDHGHDRAPTVRTIRSSRP